MFSRSLFHFRPFTLVRVAALCALLLIAALVVRTGIAPRGHTSLDSHGK